MNLESISPPWLRTATCYLNSKKGAGRVSRPSPAATVTYRKFTWIGNQIEDADMTKLFQIKKARRVPITKLVATAVREFIERTEQEVTNVQES